MAPQQRSDDHGGKAVKEVGLNDNNIRRDSSRRFGWRVIDVELTQSPGPEVFAEDAILIDLLAVRLDRLGVLLGPAPGFVFV